jgi:hypothetical protein
MRNTVEIYVIIKHETDRAYLVDAGTKEEVWIPKALIVSEEGLESGKGVIELSEEIANQKGLI